MRTPPPGIGCNQLNFNQGLSLNVPSGLGTAVSFQVFTEARTRPYGGNGFDMTTADVLSPIVAARTRQALVPGMKGYSYGQV